MRCHHCPDLTRPAIAIASILLLTVASFSGAADADTPVIPITHGQRIFSTGHSVHFGFPPILNEMAVSGGFTDSSIVGISSIGGSRVIQHVQNKDVQAALAKGGIDVLMTTPIYLPDSGIEQFAQLGMPSNPDFRLTVMEFWLPFDNYEPRNYTKGPLGSATEHINPPKVNHDAATIDALKAMHQRYVQEMDDQVKAINVKLGKPVVYVVPVGQAVIGLPAPKEMGHGPDAEP